MGNITSVSRLSAMCRNCPNVDKCNNKRMEALACLPPEYLERRRMAEIQATPWAADAVTIDLDGIKKKIVEDFYRGAGLASL